MEHPAPLVYSGPKRMTQIMGGGLLAMVAFFVFVVINGADQPPAETPSLSAAVVTVVVLFSIAAGILALGLLLVFAWNEVVIDPAGRRVTRRFHWFKLTRERSRALDDFSAVGIGLCWQRAGAVSRPYYFVRLVSLTDLWVPGGGSQETAERQAAEIARATDLDTFLDPEPTRLYPVFG